MKFVRLFENFEFAENYLSFCYTLPCTGKIRFNIIYSGDLGKYMYYPDERDSESISIVFACDAMSSESTYLDKLP